MDEQKSELLNPGTAEASGICECLACGHKSDIENWPASMSVYSDIRCPECGSTNNKHNSVYTDRLLDRMRKVDENPNA